MLKDKKLPTLADKINAKAMEKKEEKVIEKEEKKIKGRASIKKNNKSKK